MGWVSLFVPADVAELIGAPAEAEPVAILCLGPVTEFYPRPMLEQESWTSVRPLSELLADNAWPV